MRRLYPDNIAAVDFGNSTVKVYRVDFDEPDEVECLRFKDLNDAKMLVGRDIVDHVAFLSTGEISASDRNFIKENGWWEFTSETPVPMEVYYDRATLGPDRLAVALACSKMFDEGGCLIVDAGSALTLDVISYSGEFLGGNISPGKRMRFRALHEFTSRLPYVNGGVVGSRFGQNTEDAIRSGVMMGIVDEITGSYLDAVKRYEIENIVFTGGDAEVMAESVVDKISELGETPRRMILDEGLVGKGLIEAYIYNHEENI